MLAMKAAAIIVNRAAASTKSVCVRGASPEFGDLPADVRAFSHIAQKVASSSSISVSQ